MGSKDTEKGREKPNVYGQKLHAKSHLLIQSVIYKLASKNRLSYISSGPFFIPHTPPRPSEINKKNWEGKVRPFLTPHL